MTRPTKQIEQARADYLGTPKRYAFATDGYGEYHILIENVLSNGEKFYLDWIGGDYAEEPDEFEDYPPFSGLRWKAI